MLKNNLERALNDAYGYLEDSLGYCYDENNSVLGSHIEIEERLSRILDDLDDVISRCKKLKN